MLAKVLFLTNTVEARNLEVVIISYSWRGLREVICCFPPTALVLARAVRQEEVNGPLNVHKYARAAVATRIVVRAR